MLAIEDIHFLKESIPFYDQLNLDEQNLLKESVYCRKITKGEQLSGCNGLVVVKYGRLRAFILSSDGREVTLFRMLENDICILSAACLFKNVHFTVSLDVEKDSSIYVIPTKVFEELSQYNMTVKEYLLELMASRFSSAMWVMEQVVFGSLSKRVASFLLEQSLLEGSQTLAVTHEVIAKNIGSSREVISRMLKYFEKENILASSRGKIHIYDPEKLKKLAQ